MPDEIIPGNVHIWPDVTVRMQQATRELQGAGIVTIRVLVRYGKPMYWFEPTVEKIEPRAAAAAFCSQFDGAGTD